MRLCLYPLGLGCSSAKASGYGSVIDHRPDVTLVSYPPIRADCGNGPNGPELRSQLRTLMVQKRSRAITVMGPNWTPKSQLGGPLP